MIQRFVRTADLNEVYAAAHQVLARRQRGVMKLEAFKYYFIRRPRTWVCRALREADGGMLKLQADMIAAVSPVHRRQDPVGAFTTPPDDPVSDAVLDCLRFNLRAEK